MSVEKSSKEVSQVRSCGFCFTIQNPDDDDIADAMSWYEEDVNAKYMILGFEKAGRTGTPHIQGYIYYTNKVDLNVIKEIMEPHHVEPQKASKNVAAYCYCMEEGDYLEFGERPRQGHRTDLEVIKHDILNNVPIKDISKTYFAQWCQYGKRFDEFRKIHKKYDTQICLYDPENINSMKKVYEIASSDSLVVESEYTYRKQEIILKKFSGIYDYIFYPTCADIHGIMVEEVNQVLY